MKHESASFRTATHFSPCFLPLDRYRKVLLTHHLKIMVSSDFFQLGSTALQYTFHSTLIRIRRGFFDFCFRFRQIMKLFSVFEKKFQKLFTQTVKPVKRSSEKYQVKNLKLNFPCSAFSPMFVPSCIFCSNRCLICEASIPYIILVAR